MNGPPIRVYISGPALHIRPGNTDWQYLKLLLRLPEFAPELIVHRETASWRTAAFNLRFAADIAARRLGLPVVFEPNARATLPPADLRRSRSDVVYAYGYCPINTSPVPLVFHTGAIDESRMLQVGFSQAQVEAHRRRTRGLASLAALLTANSRAAMDNLAEIMPEARSKMRVLPFFLPHLTAADEASIELKFRAAGPIRLLFVGREARRKGLPEVLAAFAALDARMPGCLELTVISNFSDGDVALPDQPNIAHIESMPRDAVQERMRASHFLLMPSHFEGYGWVYLEAMAAGAIPVASDCPVQREILDEGRAGILAAANASSLENALLPLLCDRAAMERLACRSWRHCAANYLPQAVAGRMREVFAEAKSLGPRA